MMALKTKKSGLPPGVRKANPNAKKAVTHRERAPKPIEPLPGGIQERAMLVGLTVRRFHIGRNEKGATGKVNEEYGAETGMTKVRKNLLDKEVIGELRGMEAEMRSEHHFLTLPWQDDGYRILSSTAYMAYTAKMRGLIEGYNAAADALVENYDELKAEAKIKLGRLYDEKQYPSAQELRASYVAKVTVRGLPSVEDFRVTGLGAADLDAIKEQYRSDLDASLQAAHKSVWERLKEVLENAVQRLGDYAVSPEGKVSHPFRESLIGNIRELLDVLPALNVMNDPELVTFAKRVRENITTYTAETLRDDAKVRGNVIAEADAMLKKMAGYLA